MGDLIVKDAASLLHVITRTIAPASWSAKGGEGSIVYFLDGKAIVIRQSAAVQTQAERLLRTSRRAKAYQDAQRKPSNRRGPRPRRLGGGTLLLQRVIKAMFPNKLMKATAALLVAVALPVPGASTGHRWRSPPNNTQERRRPPEGGQGSPRASRSRILDGSKIGDLTPPSSISTATGRSTCSSAFAATRMRNACSSTSTVGPTPARVREALLVRRHRSRAVAFPVAEAGPIHSPVRGYQRRRPAGFGLRVALLSTLACSPVPAACGRLLRRGAAKRVRPPTACRETRVCCVSLPHLVDWDRDGHTDLVIRQHGPPPFLDVRGGPGDRSRTRRTSHSSRRSLPADRGRAWPS